MEDAERKVYNKLTEIEEKLGEAEAATSLSVVENLLNTHSDNSLGTSFRMLISGNYSESTLHEVIVGHTTLAGKYSDFDIYDLGPSSIGNYLEAAAKLRENTFSMYETVSNTLEKPDGPRAFAELIHKNARPESPFAKPISTWTNQQFDAIQEAIDTSKNDIDLFREVMGFVQKLPIAEVYAAYKNAKQGMTILENVVGIELPSLQEALNAARATASKLSAETAVELERLKKREGNYQKMRDMPLPPGVQWTTLGQDRAWRAISEFFPEVNSQELNLPKGNKDLAEFARKLNDDINRQVEMGEPATKPYDCR